MEIKRFIDIHVPIFYCNLKCSYCYVGQTKQNKEPCVFKYTPERVKKALTQDRLGGICHFNVCGMGETLIPEELSEYIKVILENGHTVMIVTNGTLSSRFKEYVSFPQELRERLGFKFSFHYLELKRLNMMQVFWDNVKLVRDSGCSFSIEITANDDYEPYIDDIKGECMKNVGAVCHVSVPRDEATGGISLYSKHSKEEFYNIWKTFDSSMFELKMRHWEERRNEFCYAGSWSGLLNLGTGELNSCYRQPRPCWNLFEDLDQPVVFEPCGKCELPHCFNGHSFLAWGVIPEISEERYLDIRDRECADGSHWVNSTMRDQFNKRLEEANEVLSSEEKDIIRRKHRKYKSVSYVNKISRKLVKIASRFSFNNNTCI